MIGYCFLNYEGTLSWRTEEFLTSDNPNFWADNNDFILKVWRFDTEDKQSMLFMFSSFKSLRLKAETVKAFAESIQFDITSLRT